MTNLYGARGSFHILRPKNTMNEKDPYGRSFLPSGYATKLLGKEEISKKAPQGAKKK